MKYINYTKWCGFFYWSICVFATSRYWTSMISFFSSLKNLRARRHDGAGDVGSVAGATATTSMASDVSRTAAHPLPAPPSALPQPPINIFLFFFCFLLFLHFSSPFCQRGDGEASGRCRFKQLHIFSGGLPTVLNCTFIKLTFITFTLWLILQTLYCNWTVLWIVPEIGSSTKFLLLISVPFSVPHV